MDSKYIYERTADDFTFDEIRKMDTEWNLVDDKLLFSMTCLTLVRALSNWKDQNNDGVIDADNDQSDR